MSDSDYIVQTSDKGMLTAEEFSITQLICHISSYKNYKNCPTKQNRF